MVKLTDALLRMNDVMKKLKLSSLDDLDMHYMRFHSLKQELEVLEDVVLDAKQERFLFIGTLPGSLGIEVFCTDLFGIRSIVDYLKEYQCASSCVSYESFCSDDGDYSSDDDGYSSDKESSSSIDDDHGRDNDDSAYDEVLPHDDVELKEETLEYMYYKEGNDMDGMVSFIDGCMDDISSMCSSYMHMDGLSCVEHDEYIGMMGDVFSPPSNELTWYPDELWACGPNWDAEFEDDDAYVVVGDSGLHAIDAFACDKEIKGIQSFVYDVHVDDGSSYDWGFDDPHVDMDEDMKVNVCHALSRIQNLRETSPACVAIEEECDLESWGSHVNVTNMSHRGDASSVGFFDINAYGWSFLMVKDFSCDREGCHYVCMMDARDRTFPFDRGKSRWC